jgi:hypothetical protein
MQFGSMTKNVADYEKLLRDFATGVRDADAKLMKTTLEKVYQVSQIHAVDDRLDSTEVSTFDTKVQKKLVCEKMSHCNYRCLNYG